MKNKDLKKGKESIIGKIIYGFLLFMPLLAIFVTCGYAMFNKNAFQSYYGETINEEVKHTGYDSADNYYNLLIYNQTQESSFQVLVEDFNYEGNLYNQTMYDNYQYINRLVFYKQDDNYICRVDFTNETSSVYWFYKNQANYQNTIIKFYILNEVTNTDFNNNVYYYTYNNFSFVSEVFYYSIDKVEQSNLFNWAQNSIIYTGIANTCTQLSITNTFIPLLLAYWLIISVVYILYDIILMILIILHNRIHRLQDSLS